jgi:hypothetical protein
MKTIRRLQEDGSVLVIEFESEKDYWKYLWDRGILTLEEAIDMGVEV